MARPCRAALVNPTLFGSCVPVNILGGVQNISPAAAAYLVDPLKVIDSKYKQYFTEAVLSGKIAEGWAGPIMAAVGASYRKDEIYQYVPDLTDEFVYLNGVSTGFRGLIPENLPNGIPGVRAGSVPPGFLGAGNLASVLFTGSYQTADTVLQGSFNVREAFTGAQRSAAQGQGRGNARSMRASPTATRTTPAPGGISSWKYGLSWQIVDAVRVRGTVSRDVRAATIRERFDSTAGGAQILDPMFNRASIATASRSGGNPNANPEKADTKTLGIVFQPSGMLEGLSFSADWYKIDISDALLQLTSQTIVDNCFNGATNLCQYVLRDPVSQQITRVDSLFINISNQVLEGVDFEAQYRHALGSGSMSYRLLGTRVLENSQQQPGLARDFLDREQPKWRALASVTYNQGPFSTTVSERFLSGRLLNRLYVEGVNVDENDVPSWAVVDLNASYRLPIERGDWRVFATVSNLLDRAPPQTPGALNFTGGTAGPNAAFYDTIGRRWVVGVNLKL